MQYGKIENYKIIGTCLMQTPDFPDEIPDEARLFDYLIDGVLYPASEDGDKIPSVKNGKVTWADDMEKLSTAKLSEIAYAFSEAIKNGSFVSETLGIEVDCRRNADKNDEQNIRGLISKMTREKIVEVEYRGKTDSAPATLEQVQLLQYEMEDHVTMLYAKKWKLESDIEKAKSATDLALIQW